MSTPATTPANVCLNCRHFRDKSYTDKVWGVCDNPKNKLKVVGLSLIPAYVHDVQGQNELRNQLEDGIRYPEDFGCIFFEPII